MSRKKKKKISSAAFNEAALFIALAVALILFISNFGLAGKFGTFFEALQFGTFGVLAYIFPLELVLGTYLMMRKGKKSGVARVKFITAFIGSFFVCAFIEMINGAYKSMEKLSEYYNFAVPVKKGGGIIGGSICRFLTPAVGKVGAYIIIVVFIIIAILIISERSILKGLSSGSRKVFKTAKDDICEYKEESEKKRVQREEAREQEVTRRRRFNQKVSGVDFSIEKGDICVLLGPSGSGKSTLLNMIGGLERPTAGKLYVDGKDLFAMTDKELVEYRKHTVGFVWQKNSRNLLPYMTAIENVQVPMYFEGQQGG